MIVIMQNTQEKVDLQKAKVNAMKKTKVSADGRIREELFTLRLVRESTRSIPKAENTQVAQQRRTVSVSRFDTP